MTLATIYDDIAARCEKKNDSPIGSKLNFRLNMAAVDPSTIKVIVEVAITLYGLFKKKDGSDSTVWLKEISGQLAILNQLLINVLQVLQELEVYLDEKFRQDAEADVLSLCRSYTQLVPELAPNLEPGEYRETLLKLLVDINRAANKVMGYGYSGAYSAFFALRVQTDLMTILKFKRSAKQELFRDYVGYFAACSNPTVPGSVANRIPIIESKLRPMIEQYPPQNNSDRPWDPPLYWIEQKLIHRGCGDIDLIKRDIREHIHLILSGSLETTFTGSFNPGEVYYGNHEGVQEFDNRDAALASAYASLHNSFLPMWNAAGTQYKMLRAQQEALQRANEACTEFKNIATQLMNEATDA